MFKLSTTAKEWISGIEKKLPFNVNLDLYYMFFLVGVLIGQRSSDNHFSDLIRDFPSSYNDHKKIIINFLLIAEQRKKAIPLDAKLRLREEILEKCVDPERNTFSDYGFNLANEYANAGFQYLSEKIVTPQNTSDFMTSYLEIIKELGSEIN